jgi:hypothetical protein
MCAIRRWSASRPRSSRTRKSRIELPCRSVALVRDAAVVTAPVRGVGARRRCRYLAGASVASLQVGPVEVTTSAPQRRGGLWAEEWAIRGVGSRGLRRFAPCRSRRGNGSGVSARGGVWGEDSSFGGSGVVARGRLISRCRPRWRCADDGVLRHAVPYQLVETFEAVCLHSMWRTTWSEATEEPRTMQGHRMRRRSRSPSYVLSD